MNRVNSLFIYLPADTQITANAKQSSDRLNHNISNYGKVYTRVLNT